MKSLKILGMILGLLLTGGLHAQTDGTMSPELKKAFHWLEKGRATFDEKLLSQAREAFEPCTNTVNGRYECCYGLAQVYLCLARVRELDKHRDEAKKLVDKGILAAQKAVLMKDSSADTHALLARLYETQLSYGDLFTGMAVGPKAGEENKKALVLDPENPQVQLAAGVQYVMAPPIGGGDVKKGIATLEKALELDPKMDEAYYWLAKAYRKLNDRDHFHEALEKALQLNPSNRMARDELSRWH